MTKDCRVKQGKTKAKLNDIYKRGKFGAKRYGKILLMFGHFEFRFSKLQKIEFCISNSSESEST